MIEDIEVNVMNSNSNEQSVQMTATMVSMRSKLARKC